MFSHLYDKVSLYQSHTPSLKLQHAPNDPNAMVTPLLTIRSRTSLRDIISYLSNNTSSLSVSTFQNFDIVRLVEATGD